jgi:hypothetical protein
MLTVSWRRKRRVPPRRGRGAIPGLFFCCAQPSTPAVAVSTGSAASCRRDDARSNRRSLRRLLRATGACYVGPAMASPEGLSVPDAELSRPALTLAQRFVQRWDLYARQLDDGSYVCVHEPLNVDHLLAHLRGESTLGAYLLDQESRARFLVLDADDAQSWQQLGHLASALVDEDVQAYLEESRRGGHLWLFLAGAVAGQEVRAFGKELLAAHRTEGVELYPKQDQIADGPGSLIRMPFGVHRLTGQGYVLAV